MRNRKSRKQIERERDKKKQKKKSERKETIQYEIMKDEERHGDRQRNEIISSKLGWAVRYQRKILIKRTKLMYEE